MTRKEAIKELQTRQGVVAPSRMKITYSEAYLTAIDMACEALTQSRAVGEWMELRFHEYTCSECGHRSCGSIPWGNYCSECGADMSDSRDDLQKKAEDKREKDIAEGRLKAF